MNINDDYNFKISQDYKSSGAGVFGIDGLTAPTKGGRAFIPPGVPKGFKESHSISNYGMGEQYKLPFDIDKLLLEGYIIPIN